MHSRPRLLDEANSIQKDERSLHVLEGRPTNILDSADCPTGTPELLELEKCEGWAWYDWAALPEPLFLPLRHLVQQRVYPFTTSSLAHENAIVVLFLGRSHQEPGVQPLGARRASRSLSSYHGAVLLSNSLETSAKREEHESGSPPCYT